MNLADILEEDPSRCSYNETPSKFDPKDQILIDRNYNQFTSRYSTYSFATNFPSQIVHLVKDMG
ncbi:MAG TPA: hypothetical protein VKA87_02670 [Nitrososphaeraceae archaeon]|nr:hypothetical protein [Nitrososphaeraceae archaeon]